MRNRFKSVLAFILTATLLASCANEQGVTETTALPETGPASEAAEMTLEEPLAEEGVSSPLFPEFKYDYEISEASVQHRVRTVTFYRDGNPISGKLTLPEGDGPFKTIIISGGLYTNLGRYSAKAQRYAGYGYAVVEFKFQNGTAPKPYKDPKYLGDFIYEQVLDLYAVMDEVKLFPEVDTNNIYLYGHSMGGLVCSYAGTMRQNEIKGLILNDPSYYACKIMKFENEKTISTDIYPLISRCYVPVVIISGTRAFAADPNKDFDQAIASLPYCDYIVLDGADHHMDGEAGNQVVDCSVEVMKKWDEEGR